MIYFWYKLVVKQARAFSNVPDKFKDEVMKMLAEAVERKEITRKLYKDITGESYQ